MAAPARPAASSGPALSLHEKALRSLLLLPRPPERLELRFDVRFWVRVAIQSSLAEARHINGRRRGDVPVARPVRATVRRAIRSCSTAPAAVPPEARIGSTTQLLAPAARAEEAARRRSGAAAAASGSHIPRQAAAAAPSSPT